MHVLFVENRSKLTDFLQRTLMGETHSVFSISDYESVFSHLSELGAALPDVIILDQDASQQTVTRFLPEFKKTYPSVKILALPEVEGSKERIRLMELGADDCLTKPFDVEELLMRIRVLGRRSPEPDSAPSSLSESLRLCHNSKDLLYNGTPLNLNRKEFQLAELFISHPQKIYSRVILFDIIWGIQADVESNVVEVTISHLRKKLNQAQAPVEINSRRNIGYWMNTKQAGDVKCLS